MDPGDTHPDFAGVVDSVMHLFGEVMSREAVSAIVDHYHGDRKYLIFLDHPKPFIILHLHKFRHAQFAVNHLN